jgi:dipicolinate synthase subunit A
MDNTAVTLHGSRALVVGYGRIGEVLSRMLRGLGAEVSVSARRSSDWAWIQAAGHAPLDTGRLSGRISGFDVIFNTVPHPVLTHGHLLELKPACLLMDLASPPGGIDKVAAGRLGLTCLHALSLPGIVAPQSAAVILRDTLYAILRERGVMA